MTLSEKTAMLRSTGVLAENECVSHVGSDLDHLNERTQQALGAVLRDNPALVPSGGVSFFDDALPVGFTGWKIGQGTMVIMGQLATVIDGKVFASYAPSWKWPHYCRPKADPTSILVEGLQDLKDKIARGECEPEKVAA